MSHSYAGSGPLKDYEPPQYHLPELQGRQMNADNRSIQAGGKQGNSISTCYPPAF